MSSCCRLSAMGMGCQCDAGAEITDLDYMSPAVSDHIATLEAENATLKAKLAKAVEVMSELAQEAYDYEYNYETTFHRDVYEDLSDALFQIKSE